MAKEKPESTMSTEETIGIIKLLTATIKERRTRDEAFEMFRDAGIITEKGNLKSPYKDIYIPSEKQSGVYASRSNLVLGFHGCELSEQTQLITDPSYIKSSNNSFDWLGHGMYFWENNPQRALLWAEQKKRAGTLKEPAVVGAVLHLGRCLDLLDASNIDLLKKSYILFKLDSEKLEKPIPLNVDHPSDHGKDKVLRFLDCAVIEYTHSFLKSKSKPPFDSVRAAFIEGEQIYPGAGFNEKTHIQICIINPDCVKGFFKPRIKHY